jgi:hypothetical protein
MIAERLALDVGHDVEDWPAGFARIVERQDVRVLQVGRRLDLGQEPVGADHGRQLGAQDLEGNLAVVLEVARKDRPWPCRPGRVPARSRSAGQGRHSGDL